MKRNCDRQLALLTAPARAKDSVVIAITAVAISLLAGCSGYTGPRSVANEDPAVKIPEIRKAVDRGDRSVAPQLVHDLDSNDSAVRFYAIEGLTRLFACDEMGYDWTINDRHARAAAIARWEMKVSPSEKAGHAPRESSTHTSAEPSTQAAL